MKRLFSILIAFFFFSGLIVAGNVTLEAPVSDVTVYSNGYGFMVREGTADLEGGGTTLKIADFTPNAIVSSVSIADSLGYAESIWRYSDVWNESKTKEAPYSLEVVLNKSIGEEVSVKIEGMEVSGTLAWYSDEYVGVSTGNKTLIYPLDSIDEFSTPVSDLIEEIEYNETKRETGLAFTQDAVAGQHSYKLAYLASGPSWSAHYKFYIGEEEDSGTGSIRGWAEVSNNVGEDWEGVNLRLVVGNPNIVSPSFGFRAKTNDYYPQAESMDYYAAGAAVPTPAPSVGVSAVSSYYVYSLSGPQMVLGGESRELPLFSSDLEYEREYFWNASIGSSTVSKIININNTGDESWAAGVFRVYSGGEFIGENNVGYTQKGDEARVAVSSMPEIEVSKVTVNTTTTEGYKSSTTVYEMRLTVSNYMSEDVELRVQDQMRSGDQVTFNSATMNPASLPNRLLEWNIPIPAGKKKVIDYTYTVRNEYSW